MNKDSLGKLAGMLENATKPSLLGGAEEEGWIFSVENDIAGIPVECYVAAVVERVTEYSVKLVEYIGHDIIVFEYKVDFDNSDGVHVFKTVCNKKMLCPQVRKIYEYATEVRIQQQGVDADHETVYIEVESKRYSGRWTPLEYTVSKKIVSVDPIVPAVRRKFNRQICNKCVHIEHFVSHIDRIHRKMQDESPAGPEASGI